MKTASFFSYDGPGRISIARWAPRGQGGLPKYRPLQVSAAMMRMEPEPFRLAYARDVLSKLDPHQVWDELCALAQPHEPILLCWERPPIVWPSHWCHRRDVAEWLESGLGVEIPEIAAPEPPKEQIHA
ncbi:MAG: hypothetical protein HYZ11_08300 [Candidatus Tectomicrobia bacterium]|uniref:DUF488 family protein n=1 Tax=Tectimicrobiota bacterium TaxID=2528274 RepID=A0A932MNB6_UNCTE|nr:hypothetical protein [Candidatus Tectomicrobia bacterium]